MAREFSRAERVADQIQRELAQLIQRDMQDPRLKLLSVSAVEVSRDLANATVFVTSLSTDCNHEEILGVLRKAAGFLRRELGRAMRLRIVPELKFRYDESLERGIEMNRLINDAVAKDRHEDEQD